MGPPFIANIWPKKFGKHSMVAVPIPDSREQLFFIFRKEFSSRPRSFRYMCAKCFQAQRRPENPRSIIAFKVFEHSADKVRFELDPLAPSNHICSLSVGGEKIVPPPSKKKKTEKIERKKTEKIETPQPSQRVQRTRRRTAKMQEALLDEEDSDEDFEEEGSSEEEEVQFEEASTSCSVASSPSPSVRLPLSRILVPLPPVVPLKNIHDYENYLFNADGVLWNEKGPLPEGINAVKRLLKKGKRVFIITNNSTKTPNQFLLKMKEMGVEGLDESSIVSPLSVMVDYFRRNTDYISHGVYVMGGESIVESLQKYGGVDCFGMGPDVVSSPDVADSLDLPSDRVVEAVIVGFDIHFSYAKLMKAANYLRNPNCGFFILNDENSSAPLSDSLVAPGMACLAAAIRASAHPREAIVFGRPSIFMTTFVSRLCEGRMEKTVLIGDGSKSTTEWAKNLRVFTCGIERISEKSDA